MRFLQINIDRRVAAAYLALATAQKYGADMVLASEPNVSATRGKRWLRDRRIDSAIGIVGPHLGLEGSGHGDGFVWVKTASFKVYSCYFSPNVGREIYERQVAQLERDIRGEIDRAKKIIVAGDFNAKSPLWGGATIREDYKGAIISALCQSVELAVANLPGTVTFERRGQRSSIDLTLVSNDLVGNITSWEVVEDEPLSPHKYILFEIEDGRRRYQKERWVYGPLNLPAYKDKITQLTTNENERTPERLKQILGIAYTSTTPKVKTKNGYVPVWWTEEIARLREAAQMTRRTLTRSRRHGRRTQAEIEELEGNYKRAKKVLNKEIRAEKRKWWRGLSDELERDIFGDGYKIVRRSMRGNYSYVSIPMEEKLRQANILFPTCVNEAWEFDEVVAVPPPFSRQELDCAISRLKRGRAPGPDGIPAEAIRAAGEVCPDYILQVMNNLLREGIFPTGWKKARLVLIEKNKKNENDPPTYRPLCVIDALSKLCENLINARLRVELETGDMLSARQYGFRQGRSTVDAIKDVLGEANRANRANPREWCALVTIDVKNAFNTLRWEDVIRALVDKGVSGYINNIIRSYLSDRKITIDNRVEITNTMGVPQGSVLGPTLWNVAYDEVLRLEVPGETALIGFADDLALVTVEKDPDSLRNNIVNALETIRTWMQSRNLEIAVHKTEATLLKGFRRENPEGFVFLGCDIEFVYDIKYLGMVIDTRMSFGPHIKRIAAKAENTVAALSKLLRNIGGPSEAKRRVLYQVASSAMLYAAPVWAGAMGVASYRGALRRVQRKMALKTSRAYVTTSYDAAVVMASTPPIDLMAWERKEVYSRHEDRRVARLEARQVILDRWQEEWANGTKGAWTRTLMPDLRPWVTRKHGSVSYHLTQALTGHGSFQTYTYRINKAENEACIYCGQRDTPKHTIFECERFERRRMELDITLEIHLTEDNLIETMLSGRGSWNAIHDYIEKVMRVKEQDERAQQGRQ